MALELVVGEHEGPLHLRPERPQHLDPSSEGIVPFAMYLPEVGKHVAAPEQTQVGEVGRRLLEPGVSRVIGHHQTHVQVAQQRDDVGLVQPRACCPKTRMPDSVARSLFDLRLRTTRKSISQPMMGRAPACSAELTTTVGTRRPTVFLCPSSEPRLVPAMRPCGNTTSAGRRGTARSPLRVRVQAA
jgi:hypothetical protein